MKISDNWLALAEQERAQEEAACNATAADLAFDLNKRLTELGITPITPATTDGHGNLFAAQLTAADEEERFYSVHAYWDETEHSVPLLVGDYRRVGYRDFTDLKRTGYEISSRDNAAAARRCVVRARREGPNEPSVPEQPSTDARALADSMDKLRVVLDNLADVIGRR